MAFVAVSDYCGAATPITITTVGSGVYSISTTDLPDAAGMDLSITYDKDLLKDPVVTTGALTANAMMVPNTATPGFVRIGIITGGSIKGTGVLALISFTKIKDHAPQPILLTPSVYSGNGTQLAAQATASESPQVTTDNKKDDSTNNTAPAAPVSTGGTVAQVTQGASASIGSVSLPQETVAKNDSSPEKVRKEDFREETSYQNGAITVPVTNAGIALTPPVIATESKSVATLPALKSSQSVLDRFRTYNDKRTIKRLSDLFDDSALRAAGIIQTPAIVVSDGKSLVTVMLSLVSETDAPSFSLKGANLKSIRRVSDKKWELDAMPQKGKTDVRLSVFLKGERIEIPLVAVSPLNKAGADLIALPMASLDTLLAKPVKINKLSYDLNSDGTQDFIDDYILAAHWLLKQQRTTGKNKVFTGK
jgi:hypothetical protein